MDGYPAPQSIDLKQCYTLRIWRKFLQPGNCINRRYLAFFMFVSQAFQLGFYVGLVAIRANRVREHRISMFADVAFYFLPVVFVRRIFLQYEQMGRSFSRERI
jgi:hypothetical protein